MLSSRQSTNFRGYRQITFGPGHSARIAGLLDRLQGREGGVLEHATHTHLVLGQPYRTPFTFLLTFIGHKTGSSVFTVPHRAWRKWRHHDVDIPTIGTCICTRGSCRRDGASSGGRVDRKACGQRLHVALLGP